MSVPSTIEQLQSRIAYQDATIAQLNEVVIAQQRQLDKLEASLNELATRLQTSVEHGDRASDPADEVPPHY